MTTDAEAAPRLTRLEQQSDLAAAELSRLIGLTPHDESSDAFPVVALDAAVFACGNASQSTYYYELAFGMELEAYSGPETGNTDHRAYVLRAGSARFVLKGAATAESPLADHHRAHGDGVIDLSLEVSDVDRCVEHARSQGVEILEEPHDVSDEHGTVRLATIAAYGDTRHTLVDRSAYDGPYLPGYVARTRERDAARPTFLAIDHCVAAVEPGRMDEWVTRYSNVLGFAHMAETILDDDNLEDFALQSKAVSSGNGRVKIAFNEPVEVEKLSGIDVFLRGYGGPGTQHFALATRDIVASAVALRAAGIELLDPPDSYYDDPELRERLADVRLSVEELKEHRILVDRDDDGYLLQVFTRPNGDRPTVFMEWLERHGSLGFGKGNFRAVAVSADKQRQSQEESS